MKKQQAKAGQESVWDYPRPPRVEATKKTILIEVGGITLVETNRAYRVLETSHPPVYYFPQADIAMDYLVPSRKMSTYCEWKGRAHYWDLDLPNKQTEAVAWSYELPRGGFEVIKDYLAFYPSKMDTCWVDGEVVQAQDGDFYGGWITKDIVGPFKGGPGTWGW